MNEYELREAQKSTLRNSLLPTWH